MLILLLIMAMFGRGQSLVDSGLNFMAAFPENVAHFCPFIPQDSLNITALHNNTEVDVYFKSVLEYTVVLQQRQTLNIYLPSDVEEHKFGVSQKTVQVIGSKYIVVVLISKQGDSVQTNVIQPYENLGMFYSIPQLNYSEMVFKFFRASGTGSTRYTFFRLIVINLVSKINVIQIVRKSQQNYEIELQPYTFYQLALDGTEIAIHAIYKVSVFITHPCVDTTSCNCNMLLNQLRPDVYWGQSFVLPFQNITTWLHLTVNTLETGNTIVTGNALAAGTLVPVQSGTHNLNTIYPASLRLISPGLIFEIIPEKMFAACYLVHFSMTYGNVAVIAETVTKSQVHKDRDLLSSESWNAIPNSKYSIVSVSLQGRHVIWHPTSKIAVYMFRSMTSGVQYGGPGVVLSDTPDPDGCLAHAGEITAVPNPMSWYESHQYCTSNYDELISPSTVMSRLALGEFLQNASNTEHWIGLRRSLLTLDWYWQKGNNSEDLVDSEDWGAEEPSDTVMGMCASILPDMTWKSARCCDPLTPLCYKNPDYFPLN